jgi:C1A family cysteine protease
MYNLGWIRQEADDRDFRLVFPRNLSLPTSVNLGDKMGPNLDQSKLGSCGPNTAAECINYDQLYQSMTLVMVSRLFVYYNTRVLMGQQYVGKDSGVDNRNMLKALNKLGWCEESLWPYDMSRFTVKPSQACYEAAKANCITNYAAVTQNLTSMKSALASGIPIIFGFDVFKQIMSDQCAETGIIAMPRTGETSIGGHDVTIFGYDDATQMFDIRNHWKKSDGTWWGKGGNGKIPYAYANNPRLSGDFWAINAIPQNSPSPNPGPTALGKIVIDLDLKQVLMPQGWK